MRRGLVIATLTGGLAVAAVAGPALSATSAGAVGGGARSGVIERASSQQALPVHGGTVDSLNWAGYVVDPPGGGVSEVTSTFTVPSSGLLPPGFAATWAGIGGYTTDDLIQAGVAEGSLPSLPLIGPQYYAWYELLPDAEVPLTGCTGDPDCAVSPGDHMGVVLEKTGTDRWIIAMADDGHWTWHTQVSYDSSGSSAEWILEAPQVESLQSLMAPVGTASFGAKSSYVDDGVTRTLAQGDPTTIDESAGGFAEATPSTIAADGQSFDVCTYSSTCTVP